jgi:hypothetical protein
MTERPNDLLDETTLRRALRLEADERAPLFDPAAIAAAARVRPRMVLVSAFATLAVGIVGAVAVWSAVAFFLPTFVADALDLGLGTLAFVAVPVSAIWSVVQQPAVPLSLVAAIAIATLHELRELSFARSYGR